MRTSASRSAGRATAAHDARHCRRENVRGGPGDDRRAHAAVQGDHEEEHPDEGEDRRERLDRVPRAHAGEPEQDPGDRLPEHVRDERAGGDHGQVVGDVGQRRDEDEQSRPREAESDREREGTVDERAEVGASLAHPRSHGESELPEQA